MAEGNSVESEEQGAIFSAKFEKPKQIVSALNMVGAGFEMRGGSSLMLTEAVENGVDAIIKAKDGNKKLKGVVKVITDQKNKRIMVIDNGTGFLEIKHVCEKPFDSLKEMDDSQTGQFARGLQGFRAFCSKLIYLTKRLPKSIPESEKDYMPNNRGISNVNAKLEFSATSSDVKVTYIDESELNNFLDSPHGTVAIYENWKTGEFEKFNVNMLIRRLQHHFGELIRQGEIKILVEVNAGKIEGIGPEQFKFQEVEPRDYSDYTAVEIPDIPYNNNGKNGKIEFNLYLCDRGRKDRWNQPYLLYKDRPVGDGFIADIDEFTENPIWQHKFLTGYVTCDFCEINELRQGLKINDERDFLFKELLKTEKILEKKVKEHSKGLYELKLQRQVAELVKDLQMFFKAKKIFNFKIAKSSGFLSKEDNEIEVVELAKDQGSNPELEVKSITGEGAEFTGTDKFEGISVTPNTEGEDKTLNPEIGGHGGESAGHKVGSPGQNATPAEPSEPESEPGFKQTDNGYNKPVPETAPHDAGGKEKTKRKGSRQRLRGFGLVFQDDEFNEDLSWFDDVSSVVIINSLHPRFLARAQDETRFKALMDYLAELYIWEITKLVHAKDEDTQRGMKFLDYKFEYTETVRVDDKVGRFLDESGEN